MGEFDWNGVSKEETSVYKKYFDYFAKLPEIKVINKIYNIREAKRLYKYCVCNMELERFEETSGRSRMTFVFRNKCIFQHSSVLPDIKI